MARRRFINGTSDLDLVVHHTGTSTTASPAQEGREGGEGEEGLHTKYGRSAFVWKRCKTTHDVPPCDAARSASLAEGTSQCGGRLAPSQSLVVMPLRMWRELATAIVIKTI